MKASSIDINKYTIQNLNLFVGREKINMYLNPLPGTVAFGDVLSTYFLGILASIP